eukprot:g37531.t1
MILKQIDCRHSIEVCLRSDASQYHKFTVVTRHWRHKAESEAPGRGHGIVLIKLDAKRYQEIQNNNNFKGLDDTSYFNYYDSPASILVELGQASTLAFIIPWTR